MYYQQAKHVGWRRYDDHLAIVSYLRNQLTILGGPAAALWEQMATPISLGDALSSFGNARGQRISALALRMALKPLIAKGMLIEGESRDALTNLYDQRPDERGFYMEDMCGGFFREMRSFVHPEQMIKADVELNAACNLRCVHCYITDYKDRDLMSLDEIYRLFDELAEIGVLFLNLTGGEMTLRKDFVDIIQAARDRHFVVSIMSNATRLSEDALAGLRIAAPANVYVSLYGVTAETHERITNRAGTFAATLANIKRLRASGIPVVLRYLIMRHNVDELGALPAFAEAHDCLYTSSNNLFVIDGPKEFLGEHRISDTQRTALWQHGLIKPPSQGACTAGKQRVRIDARGNVYPCELLRIKFGNVRYSSLVDVMSSPVSLHHLAEIHSLPKQCGSCSKHQHCPRCPGMAYHEDGNVRGNSSFACQITDAYRHQASPTLVPLRIKSAPN